MITDKQLEKIKSDGIKLDLNKQIEKIRSELWKLENGIRQKQYIKTSVSESNYPLIMGKFLGLQNDLDLLRMMIVGEKLN